LYEYEGLWHLGTWQQLDTLVEQYMSMQSPYRGGFILGDIDTDEPDFRTTALVLETLDAMGELDSIDTDMVIRYLWSSFRGSITLRSLLTEGLFEDKYWAIRTANTLDCIQILGLRGVDLDHIIAPEANMAEFPELDQYYRWDEQILSNNELVRTGFESKSFEVKLQVIETVEYIIDPGLTPTLISLFVDVDSFIEEVDTRLDVDTGVSMNDFGMDAVVTSDLYDTLDTIGKMDIVFDDDFGAYKPVDAVREIDARIQTYPHESSSVSEIHSFSKIITILDSAMNNPVMQYIPCFDDSTDGISSWDSNETISVIVPDILWEVPSETTVDQSPLSLVMIIALLGGVIVSAAADNKRLAVILSVFCIFLFFGEYAYGVDTIMQQAAAFVGSVISDLSQNNNVAFNMNQWGTRYVDLDYKGPVEDEDEPVEEVDITPIEPDGVFTESFLGLENLFSRGVEVEIENGLRRFLFNNIPFLEIEITAELAHIISQLDMQSSQIVKNLDAIIKEAIKMKSFEGDTTVDTTGLAQEVVNILKNWNEGKETPDDRLVPAILEWLIVQKVWNTHSVESKRTVAGAYIVTKIAPDGTRIDRPIFVSSIEELQNLDKSSYYEITMLFSNAETDTIRAQLLDNPTLKSKIAATMERDGVIDNPEEAILYTAYGQVIMAAARSGLTNVRVQAVVSYSDGTGKQQV
ncbi:MAG: hypothetical protein ACXABY_32970, partial [Candidatus Thorarchaeota archaeon]